MTYDEAQNLQGQSVNKSYIFRAGIEWNVECYDEANRPHTPACLPIDVGQFHLDLSPNAQYYCAQMGWTSSDEFASLDEPPPNQDFPNSILYAETRIEIADDRGDEESTADRDFEQLEAMLRLFLPGEIYLRRNLSFGFPTKDNAYTWVCYVFHRPIKPKPEILYQRVPYVLDEQTLRRFARFFTENFDLISKKDHPLYIAARRFNSSYERRTLSDRLIELMIAMEALCGDQDYQRYKIPLRCSCLLEEPGADRKATFADVKKLYDQRSSIIHGGKLELEPGKEDIVDRFEGYVRKTIMRLLELHKSGHHITSGSDLDDFLFFTKGS
jgi:hypothetical protein